MNRGRDARLPDSWIHSAISSAGRRPPLLITGHDHGAAGRPVRTAGRSGAALDGAAIALLFAAPEPVTTLIVAVETVTLRLWAEPADG